MRTVSGCPAVFTAPVISHGSAPVWMAGQAASVTKVTTPSSLQNHETYMFKFCLLNLDN